jgi:extracellular factor (EF) 3-hydroxypalmitic acid methyl ester biosynthesis protein
MTSIGEDSYVAWQLEDGPRVRARILRLSRLSIAFSLLNPDAALRSSEVLAPFEVVIGSKAVYSGRALVSSLLHAGTHTVCEVHLDPPGVEPDLPVSSTSPPEAGAAYESFVARRDRVSKVDSKFQAAVLDMQMFLTDVRGWVEQLEVKLHDPNGKGANAQLAVAAELSPKVLRDFNMRHERWDELARRIEPSERGLYQDFLRYNWHPLFLCCPFAWRAYHKPLGYAGDYEMMNMIHRFAPEGTSLYAKIMHQVLVSQWPAQSVRNRVRWIEDHLVSETARAVRAGRRARILNIGCGPAWEMQELLRKQALSSEADLTLLDFNEETVAYAKETLTAVKRQSGRRTGIDVQRMSMQQLLMRAQKGKIDWTSHYDLVYCAGLFDYLSDGTCKALVRLFWNVLAPGGLLVVANMADTQPFRNCVEFILDWYLIYRNRNDLVEFCPPEAVEHAAVEAELTSVNVFLSVRKPA